MRLRSRAYGRTTTVDLFALRLALPLLLFAPKLSLVSQSVRSQILVPYRSTQTGFGFWPRIDFSIGTVANKATQNDVLSATNLLVTEDGVEQTNIEVVKSTQPLSICFVIDKSSSIKKNRKFLAPLVRQLFPINTTAEAAIVAFDTRVYLEQDFTTEAARLGATLGGNDFGGGSGLYDAVWVAMDQVSARSPERKKIVVVLSDGDDNFSRVPVEDLERKARLLGAPTVYWLGFPSSKATMQPMGDIATATGGASSISPHISLMTESADTIADLLRKTYFDLRYTSTHSQRDGRLHKVTVKSKPNSSESLNYLSFRREYYAPTK